MTVDISREWKQNDNHSHFRLILVYTKLTRYVSYTTESFKPILYNHLSDLTLYKSPTDKHHIGEIKTTS